MADTISSRSLWSEPEGGNHRKHIRRGGSGLGGAPARNQAVMLRTSMYMLCRTQAYVVARGRPDVQQRPPLGATTFSRS